MLTLQDSAAWLKHRVSHASTTMLLNSMVGISANCASCIWHKKCVQTPHCRLVHASSFCVWKLAAAVSACYGLPAPNLFVDNRTARCSNKERIQDRGPNTVEHLVSEPALLTRPRYSPRAPQRPGNFSAIESHIRFNHSASQAQGASWGEPYR